ncbi:MAG: hypothetical protein JSS15_03855 [Proteobacteria bacterium]|nr:hypothetical protein [Pseudomonadota bacterium]
MKFLGIVLMVSSAAAVAAPAPQSSPVAAQQAPAAVEHAADSRDKMICKRFVETGSLVRGTRVCKTKWEWEQDRENIRAQQPGVDSCRSSGTGGPC